MNLFRFQFSWLSGLLRSLCVFVCVRVSDVNRGTNDEPLYTDL